MSYTFTLAENELEAELKKLIVQEADKADDVDMDDFTDDALLFGDWQVRSVWIRLMHCKISVAFATVFPSAPAGRPDGAQNI